MAKYQYVSESKIYNPTNTAAARLTAQGYTPDEIKEFKRATAKKDDAALAKLPCKCSNLPDGVKCEKCHFIAITELFRK